MSFVDLTDTPLHVLLRFNQATDHAEDNPNPEEIDLQFAPFLRALLPAGMRTVLEQAIRTPLVDRFHGIWRENRDGIVLKVEQEVRASMPGAYNIQVFVPQTGTLHAEVTEVSDDMRTLDGGTTGKQLNLSYRVPGIGGTCYKTTDGPLGPWADPYFSFHADCEVLVNLLVPDQAAVPLAVKASIRTSNAGGSVVRTPPGVAWFLGEVIERLRRFAFEIYTGAPGSSSGGGSSDKTTPLSNKEIAGLIAQIALLSSTLRDASEAGFRTLEPRIIVDRSGSTAAALHLTHPLDPAPAVWNRAAAALAGPTFVHPSIGTSVPIVPAGGALWVRGAYFPLLRTDELDVAWAPDFDPRRPETLSMAPVVKSEIHWGAYPMHPPGPVLTAPSSLNKETVTRTSYLDGRGRFTTPRTLRPSTWYGFRARDFSPFPGIATRWSPWHAFKTAGGDAVELRIEYLSNSASLAALVPSGDGTFAVQVTIPPGVPPGTHRIVAALDGQDLASASIQIAAPADVLQPIVHVLNPSTGIPISGLAYLMGTYRYTLQGFYFGSGNVQIFIDNPNGTQLGQATLDGNGSFNSSFDWPYVASGAHTIVAVGQNTRGSAAVFGQTLPH